VAIGTDVTDTKPCSFSLVESFAYIRTLAPSERLQIYDHLDEVYHHYLSPLAVERPPSLRSVWHLPQNAGTLGVANRDRVPFGGEDGEDKRHTVC
jgi:hypothetical protein